MTFFSHTSSYLIIMTYILMFVLANSTNYCLSVHQYSLPFTHSSCQVVHIMIWAHLRNLLTSVIVIIFIKVEQQNMVKFQVFFFFIAKEEIFPADGKRQRLSTSALERVRVSPRLIWTGYRGSWQLSESGHNVPICKTLAAVSTQDSMILQLFRQNSWI